MNTTAYSRQNKMSFSLCTVSDGLIPKGEGLADTKVRQARMHPPSTGGPVLRLRSRRALSPVPPEQCGPVDLSCHCKTLSRSEVTEH
jgi:hypothetical protein